MRSSWLHGGVHFPEASFSQRAGRARKGWPLRGQWTRASEAAPAGRALWFSGQRKRKVASWRLGSRRLGCGALEAPYSARRCQYHFRSAETEVQSLNRYFESSLQRQACKQAWPPFSWSSDAAGRCTGASVAPASKGMEKRQRRHHLFREDTFLQMTAQTFSAPNTPQNLREIIR